MVHFEKPIMKRNFYRAALATAALAASAVCASTPLDGSSKQLLVIGNDGKRLWDDRGRAIHRPPGNDSVWVLDIGTDPRAPRIVGILPLGNSVVGPPVNVAVTPNERLALVANSIDVTPGLDDAKRPSDDRVWVIDLTASPPTLMDTVRVGRQPSGIAINRTGTLALVANRGDASISVLRIRDRRVEVIDKVDTGEQVAHLAFTPDGKRAIGVKFVHHKVAFFDVEGERVTYRSEHDLPVGHSPYNVDVTPDGQIALVANNGSNGGSDGKDDTVSVIDMTTQPPTVIDNVVVGDGPEGFAMGPDGRYAVVVLLRGSNADKSLPHYRPNSEAVALKIDGKKVTRLNGVEVPGFAEGVAFRQDGRTVYVGSYTRSSLHILEMRGDTLVDTGVSMPITGHPASMRTRPH